MPVGETWTAEEIETLRSLYGMQLTAVIAQHLPGRTQASIALKARSLGLKGDRKLTRKQYDIDYDYFRVPDLENSYWAGFIAADGNIDDAKDRVRIKFLESDAPHLELFRACCGCGSPLRDAPNGERNYKTLEINGTGRWREDLFRNYCITPRKTLTLQPPSHLPPELSLAFITGYIDGDGCIFLEKPRTGYLRLGLHLIGTQEMLLGAQTQFDTMAPLQHTANVNAHGKVWTYKIVGRKAEAVCRVLLSIPTPKLNRKWTKAEQFLEQKEKDDSV